MKTVLYVNYYASPVSTRFLDGVFRYAHEAKWNVQVVDMIGEDNLRKLVKFWNPIGCIYGANDGIKPKLLKILSDRPLVLMDCDESFSWPDVGKVCNDAESVTGVVVREFLSMGIGNFAFCGYRGLYPWTERRERIFRRFLGLNGKDCETIWIDPADSENERLRFALRRLKRPCGLFAANDDIARRVLGACRMARIPVPDGISVIGVDDDEHISKNTRPSLSSVLPDYEQAGYAGAAMLGEIIGGASPRMEMYGAKMLVRRGSSHAVKVQDDRVKAAVEFIRGGAGKTISAKDVAESMGCTLRMAEILFNRALGHSVKDEIVDARIAHVKRLLADRRIGISAIADMCGYADGSSLRRAFLAKTGCSMSEWRRSARMA